ncbi:hypothetical protein BH11PLA1_BH11PLA1_16900 [soil metagenome]
MGPFSLERVVTAMDRVRERLLRATGILEQRGVPYAVAGGNAVALWVSRVDETAVRQTSDVDILIRRDDFGSVRAALESVGFQYRHVGGLDVFLDGPLSKVRDGVHLLFAREQVRSDEPAPNPDVIDSESAQIFRVLTLPALVQIKLTAWRDKDRTHLRDLIEVGLLDATWLERVLPPLRPRLQHLLDTPGG